MLNAITHPERYNLFDKFEITDTVLCAYNAGEGNVARWLKDEKYSKNNLSLDIIPFKETREYVKKVNKNFKIKSKTIFKTRISAYFFCVVF